MIHIDGIIFSLQAHGGISVYFRELLGRLRSHQVATHLSTFSPMRADLGVLRSSDARIPFSASTAAARPLERYRRAGAVRGASVFHSSYYRRSKDARVPAVVTVHDFAYERCVPGIRRWVHSAQKFAAIREAQAIICISKATRDDLIDLVGVREDQRVYVIYNGVGEQFHALGSRRSHEGCGPPFALFVGVRSRYKNFALAANALAHVPELELHCVGGGPLTPHELDSFPAAVRQRVKHLGHVDDERLNQLYNQAQCLVYPSAYEGFGIPVVEAMRAGCPVVSIRCKAVLEVGGDALLVADAQSEALADAMRAAASARGDAARLRGLQLSQEFSWDRHFTQTLAVYRDVANVQ
jgi:mannosyltransferase